MADRTTKDGFGVLGVGAAACVACCAPPLVAFLAAASIGTIIGIALFGALGLIVAAVAAVLYLRRRPRARYRKQLPCRSCSERSPMPEPKLIPIYDATAAIACTITNTEIPERIALIERMRTAMTTIDRTPPAYSSTSPTSRTCAPTWARSPSTRSGAASSGASTSAWKPSWPQTGTWPSRPARRRLLPRPG